MEPLLVKVTSLHGTPVFLTVGTDRRLAQVYGATFIDHVWYYPAFLPASDIVLKDMRLLKLPVTFSPKAQELITKLAALKQRYEAKQLPEGFQFKTTPRAHQLDGLIHLLYYWRVALFYACGLGKTKIIIDWQRAVPNARPLVVCPKVVVGVWARELKVHGINQEYRIVDADAMDARRKQIEDSSGYQGLVLSYDTMVKLYEDIARAPYNCMVADESHCIKSIDSTRTKVALELANKASRRVVMSGTPSMGDPLDLYAQLRFLSISFVPEEFWKFKQTYCVTAPQNKRIVIGFKNLNLLNKRVNLVALRKTKEECLDLPKQVIIDYPVVLSKEAFKYYDALAQDPEATAEEQELIGRLAIGERAVVEVAHAAVRLNKLLQICCGFLYAKDRDQIDVCNACPHLRDCVYARIRPFTQKCLVHPQPATPIVHRIKQNAKLEALTEILDETLEESTNKVIIWGQFTPELDLIEDRLQELKLGHVRVDGRSSGMSAVLAERFNTDRECRVYLGQVSTGVGLTLNAANYMVYFSVPWKLGDVEQSQDRNHRIGQERDTTIFRLLAKGSVDMGIALALRTKHTVAESVTAAVVCARCPHNEACCAGQTVPFGDGCIYARKVTRHITKPEAIKDENRH